MRLLSLLSAEACTVWLLATLRPSGPACPKCGAAPGQRGERAFFKLRAVQCRACGSKYTALSGSLLSGSQLRPAQIALLAALDALGVPSGQVAAEVGVDARTVRRWRERLARAGLTLARPSDSPAGSSDPDRRGGAE